MTTPTQSIERIVEYTFDPNSKSMVECKNTIGTLTPLTATKSECDSGWIRAVNRIAPAMYGKRFNMDNAGLQTVIKSGFQGKWIIHFNKKDPKIVEIWDKVREGVRDGAFPEAKVSIPSDGFSDQVICVYTVDHNNKEDVSSRLKELVNRGIIKNNVEIFYKTESATRANLNEYKYSSKDFTEQTNRISAVFFSVFRSIFTFIGNTVHSLGMRFFSLFQTKNA